MITVTEKAEERIKELMQKHKKPQGYLRINVVPGGCSGLSYEFEVSDAMGTADWVFERNGAKVVVDNNSYLYMNGSTVEYQQDLMKSGFVIQNPNAVSSCACGTSFCT